MNLEQGGHVDVPVQVEGVGSGRRVQEAAVGKEHMSVTCPSHASAGAASI